MAATPYLLTLPTQDADPARNLVNGVEAMVIMAGSANDAKAMAKAQFENDVDSLWTNATATAIVADTSIHGWTFELDLANADGSNLGTVSLLVDGVTTAAIKATGSVNDTAGAPNDGDQFDIAGTTYTFKTALTPAAHEVLIGGSAVNAIAHLVQAITYDGGAGINAATNYVGTVPDPNVTAVVDATTTKADITALVAGTAGNALILTAPTNVSTHLAVSAATLAGGVNADTVDSLGAAMVAKLNAAGLGITHAAYVLSTHTLTVAGTADNLGDHTFVAKMLPANRQRDVSIDAFFGTHTDGGASGAALSLVLASTHVIPLTAGGFRLLEGSLVTGAVVTASPCIVSIQEDGLGATLTNNVDTAVLYAATATDAKAYAKAMYAPTMPAPWGAATPALIAVAADLAGFKLRVTLTAPAPAAYDVTHTYSTNDKATYIDGQVYKATQGSTGVLPTNKAFWVLVENAGAPAVDQTYVGVTSDTFDLFGAGIVALLNADPSGLVANAAYNSTTQVVTVAGTVDALGDYSVGWTFSPPGSEAVTIPGFVVAHVDVGLSSAAVTITLAADAYTLPQVCAQLRRV